ncbi:MAG TPA: hypothetical protein VG014_05760 [Acidimicrobiales bacterium]|jgi:hypothetical protein|nr:hypothetical protein [Acidimicrobiales bacterium]
MPEPTISHEELASIRDRIRRQRLAPPTAPVDVQAIRQRVFKILFAAKPEPRVTP